MTYFWATFPIPQKPTFELLLVLLIVWELGSVAGRADHKSKVSLSFSRRRKITSTVLKGRNVTKFSTSTGNNFVEFSGKILTSTDFSGTAPVVSAPVVVKISLPFRRLRRFRRSREMRPTCKPYVWQTIG